MTLVQYRNDILMVKVQSKTQSDIKNQGYKVIPISLGFEKARFQQLDQLLKSPKHDAKLGLDIDENILVIHHKTHDRWCFQLAFKECKTEYICVEARSNIEFELLKNTNESYQRALIDFIVNVFILDNYKPFPKKLEQNADIIQPCPPKSDQIQFTGTQHLEVNAKFYFYYSFKSSQFWEKLHSKLADGNQCILDGYRQET